MSNKQVSDSELVTRLVNQHSEDAFCELYIRYRPKLLVFCMTFVKVPEAAEDVVQEVFTTVWTGRRLLDPKMSFSSYLYTITRNRMLNFLRAVQQDTKVKAQLQKAGSPEMNNVENQLLDNEYNSLLDAAIAQLNPLRQNIFRLSRKEHKSHKEIAQLLNISPYTVQENISAALRSIKIYIHRHTEVL